MIEAASRPHQPRRDERYPVRLQATWLHPVGLGQLLVREVSFSGLAAEAHHAPALRHLIRCRVVLPTTRRPFVFHAMVVHQLNHLDEGWDAPVLFGAMLYALDREARATWANLVQYARLHPGELDTRRAA